MKKKKNRHGLRIEQGLNVVENAGFRAGKKRDRSVNRRAGLHDKKRDLKGESRIYRVKPLGIVRVRRVKQIVATLSACLVAVIAYFGMGFIFKPDFIYVEELGNSTVCALAPIGDGGKSAVKTALADSPQTGEASDGNGIYYFPSDGSLPTDHTLIENVAYMNYALKCRTAWSSYMESAVHTAMEQKVYTHKKFYGGKLISADMPQGASNIARQFCVTDTEVRWREKSKNYIYDSMDNVEWPNVKPTGLTIGEFRIYRGLPATEFSVYILNEKTVYNWNDTTVEEIGEDESGKKLYSMTLELRVHQSGLDSAVHYYKQQMYVTGGLYAWPTFDYTYVTYVFDEDWTVRQFTINDSYKAKMGSIEAPCTSESTTVFDYDEEKAQNTLFEDYFDQPYEKWDPLSASNDPTAASCLASAFGDVLTEGATLKLELNVDGKPVNGAVHLGMDGGGIDDLRVLLSGSAIGDIKAYLGEESGKKMLYIALGANKYKIAFDAFATSDAAAVAEQEEGEPLLDTNALINQLFEGDFKLGKKNKSATLESNIELFGINVPVKFSFDIKKNIASLNEVTAEFKLGKNNVSARLTFGTEADIPAQLSASERAQYLDVFDGVTLGANVKFGEVDLAATAYIGFEDGGISEIRAKLGDLTVYYLFDEFVYLSDGNVKYKLNVSALSDGEKDGGESGIDLSGLDLKGIIEDAIANFYMGGGTISTGLKLDLTNYLEQILNLAVSVDLNNGLGANVSTEFMGKAVSVGVKLTNETLPALTDKNEYVDILNGTISLNFALSLDGSKLEGLAQLTLTNGELAEIGAKLSGLTVYYNISDGLLYVTDGTVKYMLDTSALSADEKAAKSGNEFDLSAFDLKAILTDVINNLTMNGGLISTELSLDLTQYIDQVLNLAVSLDLNNGLGANVSTEFMGKAVSVGVKLTNETLPALTDKNEYVDILNGTISLDFALSLDGVQLKGLAMLELSDGEIEAVRASLQNGTVEIYYEKEFNADGGKEDVIYIALDKTAKIKLPVSALSGDASQVNLGGAFDGLNIKSLIFEVIDNLSLADGKLSSALTLSVDTGAVMLELPLDFSVGISGGIKVEASTVLYGKRISANVSLTNQKITEPSDKQSYVDVINDGFNISGKVELNANGTVLQLKINSLTLKLNGEFAFELNAQIVVADKYFDIYAQYSENTLTLVYGSDESTETEKGNFVGVRINTQSDLETLKTALKDMSLRLRAVADTVVPNGGDTLSSFADGVGAGSTLTDALDSILAVLGINLDGGSFEFEDVASALGIPFKDGKIDVEGLIRAISLKSFGDGIAVTLGDNISVNLGVNAGGLNGGAQVQFGNATVGISLTDIRLDAFKIDCPVSENDLLYVVDLIDMLDYAVAAVELVCEQQFALQATTTVYEDGKTGTEVEVLLEYDRGTNGFPVHVDTGTVNEETGIRENVNFWIDPTSMLHFNLKLTDTSADGTNIYLDVYVLDANPSNKTFSTGGSYYADGELDLYVSISNGGGNPLNIYLPMEDLLTIVAVGGAMLNLGSVEVGGSYNGITEEQLADLNNAIKQVAAIVDSLLVQHYIGDASRYQAIGNSIVEQILRGQKIEASNLSELIELVLRAVFGSDKEGAETLALYNAEIAGEESSETPEVPALQSGNFVKRVDVDREGVERSFSIVLNSSAIYGANFNDITFSVFKNYYEAALDGEEVIQAAKSRVTGLSLANVYYGEDYAKRLDISASIKYEVTKPESFAKYYNFSDISTLITTFVNSATHDITENTPQVEKEGDGLTSGDLLDMFGLNSNYYIDGSFNIDALGADVDINVEYFYVTINDDNTVEFKIRLSYKKASAALVIKLIEQDATVDLSIKDDMVFVIKHTKSGDEERIMTLTAFGDDIMDQISWMLSFSSMLRGAMNMGGDGGGGGLTFNDYGDYVEKFLANYSYTESGDKSVWQIDANKGAINDLVGINLLSNNITVKFNAEGAERNRIVKSLSINTKLFSIITVAASLNYKNPQNVWEGGSDLSGSVINLYADENYGVDGVSWQTILGGTKIEDINAAVDWDRLCLETSGSTYLLYTGSNLHYGDIAFEYAEDKTNSNYLQIGESVKALYGGSSVYSKVNTPSLEGIVPDPKAYAWRNTFVKGENNVAILRADYKWHTVEIASAYKVEGGIAGFTEYRQENGLFVYYGSVAYGTLVDFSDLADLNVAKFIGIFNAETGEKVTGYKAIDNGAFRVEWVGKLINVTYSSDVAVNESEAEENGIYTFGATLQYGVSDSLITPSTGVGNVTFLGWFIEYGGSYTYVANADALKDYCANIIAGDYIDVKLWAVWYNNVVTGEVTEASHSGSVLHTWSVKGTVNSPFIGKSAEIEAVSSIFSYKIVVGYYVSKDGVAHTREINNLQTDDVTANKSFDKTVKASTVGTGTGTYVGVKVTMTITFNGKKTEFIGGLYKQI